MSNQSFLASVTPDAQIASARTGVPVAVILAQWAIETGWGTSPAWLQGNNYAGVSYGGSVNSFPDRAAGLAAYINVMNQSDYATVRSAGGDAAAAAALGASPWAASHYADASGVQGSLLDDVITENNLTQYDTGGTATLLASPLGPAGNAAGDVVGGVTSAAVGSVVDALQPILLKGLLLTGGVALVVLAGWKATTGARATVKNKATQAAEIAAVAA